MIKQKWFDVIFDVIFQDGKAKLKPKGSSSGGVVIGVRKHGLYRLTGKPIDHEKQKQEKVRVLEVQRGVSSSRGLLVQRENVQPKKSAWSVGSKGDSTTGKKESWNGLKAFQEKKKQEASSGSDTFEKGVVHASRYARVVSTRS